METRFSIKPQMELLIVIQMHLLSIQSKTSYILINDISFLVDSQMTLYEQQSTYNPNMPLRGLMYFAQLYQMYLNQQEKDLFRQALVRIPNPQFVVFYNGATEKPDKMKITIQLFKKTANRCMIMYCTFQELQKIRKMECLQKML